MVRRPDLEEEGRHKGHKHEGELRGYFVLGFVLLGLYMAFATFSGNNSNQNDEDFVTSISTKVGRFKEAAQDAAKKKNLASQKHEVEFRVREKKLSIQAMSNPEPHVYIPQMERLIIEGRQTIGKDHFLMGEAHFHLGMMKYNSRMHAEAEKDFREALRIYRNHLGEEHEFIWMTYGNLGNVVFSQGRYEEALDYYQKSYENLKRYKPANNQDLRRMSDMLTRTQKILKEREKGQ